jgi:spermidine synthase
MKLLDIFFPHTVNFPDSPHNKNLQLLVGFGEPTLVSDSLIESGHLLTNIWKIGIKKLLPKSFIPQTILLLGLGGGSNAHLVSKKFPKSQITAIEIDPQMVKIAKDYFHVDKIKNLEIIIEDAEKYISNLKSESYDLILVDCFVGKNIPQPLQKMSFIKNLYISGRFVLINRIWFNEHHFETVFFLRELSKHFFFLKTHTRTNVVISLL